MSEPRIIHLRKGDNSGELCGGVQERDEWPRERPVKLCPECRRLASPDGEGHGKEPPLEEKP